MKMRRGKLDFDAGLFEGIVFTMIGRKDRALSGKVSVVHIRQPARCDHPEVVHKKTRELVIAISGRATARIGGRTVPLRSGTVVEIPPGIWHSFRTQRLGLEALSVFIPAANEKNPDVFVRPAGHSRRAGSRR